MIQRTCFQYQSESHRSYRVPNLPSYEVSGIKAIQKVTGEYHEKPFSAPLITNKCKSELYSSLLPVKRNIHSPKPELNRSSNYKKFHECFIKQPNKFLEDLPNQYPNLYDSLIKKRHLQTACESQRSRSTVQADIGHVPEYPSGPFNFSVSNENNDVNVPKWYLVDPCNKTIPTNNENVFTCLTGAKMPPLPPLQEQTGHFPEIWPVIFSRMGNKAQCH